MSSMQTDNPSASGYDLQADREWINQRLAKFRLIEKFDRCGAYWELQRKRFYGWAKVDSYPNLQVARVAFRVALSPTILYDWHAATSASRETTGDKT